MDFYDTEIERITRSSKPLNEFWLETSDRQARSPLFAYVTPDRRCSLEGGCLTQIKAGLTGACTPALARAIRKDQRLPKSGFLIELKHLPVFAQWQRRIDKMLKREPPRRP